MSFSDAADDDAEERGHAEGEERGERGERV